MKMIIAMIKPNKLDDVHQELNAVGISGMTAMEVKGYGRQKGHTEKYRGAEYQIQFLPKIMILVAVNSELVDKAIKAIETGARTGNIGDGKIFVLSLEEALRIRTGETGPEAI
jgi:nitrogen regulatory protein P-II 2